MTHSKDDAFKIREIIGLSAHSSRRRLRPCEVCARSHGFILLRGEIAQGSFSGATVPVHHDGVRSCSVAP
jgi:hypothetical protein